MSSLELLIVQDIQLSPLSDAAGVVLPGASFAEKAGTFINVDGRVQCFEAAMESPGEAQDDLILLQKIWRTLDKERPVRSAREIYIEMAKGI